MLQEADVGTEAERSEALVVRANKLDILERLADDLAHEIKNPLHSMVINLEVLKRRITRLAADDQGEALRYIGVLGTELDRVTRRIELLLRLTRPARRAEPASLDELVGELLELVQLEGRRQEVEVRFEPAALAAQVHVPREAARQVILDLILDALDRLERGSTLLIRTGQLQDRAVVYISGNDGAGRPVRFRETGDPADGAGRLLVAEVIAERIGGRVETSGEAPDAEGAGIVFSVPLGCP
ncbi:MAG TPA: histidine kinase dimerization/phospho-acceptor domain-containing protein [Longimicrobiaceae bacterium]|nr:histidine kinase dimerization/phospho-acceptor domain-containing protein [Longimicrobiaceae bacterium]